MISKHSISFKSSWWFPLIAGIAISIQQIQVWACADEVNQPGAHNFTQGSLFHGHPVSSFQINRPGYSLEYDASRRNPKWVFEHLSSEGLKGGADRSLFGFKEDESLPPHLRASLSDYRGSGFDRGHMAPAADHRSSLDAMADTFYLTNICPQCPQFNRGFWAKFEKHVRDLTQYYKDICVITGPLYLPYSDKDGKRYVKYEVIGQNDISVPTHFFKVITMKDWKGDQETMAYILPNAEISQDTNFESFRTTVEKVERAAGIIFSKEGQK